MGGGTVVLTLFYSVFLVLLLLGGGLICPHPYFSAEFSWIQLNSAELSWTMLDVTNSSEPSWITLILLPKISLFSCPADSSIGDLVTHWLTEWVRDLFKNTTTEWPQRRVTFETFDQSDEETWPEQKKRQRQWQIQRQRQWQRQIYLESTFKERS